MQLPPLTEPDALPVLDPPELVAESAAPPAPAPAPPPAPPRPAAPLPTPDPVLASAPAPHDINAESLARKRPALEPPPGRRNGAPRPPGQGRFLHVVVPGVLMLGVAAAAIIAGTRGG